MTEMERIQRNRASDKWKLNNPDRVKKSSRKWYLLNQEERKAYRRAYYAAHKQQCSIGNKTWRVANDKRRKRYFKLYNSTPDRKIRNIEYTNRRRTIVEKVTITDRTVIRQWLKSWKTNKSVRCYWCGTKSIGLKCHLDHIVALSIGGQHSIDNVCIACRRCNYSKHKKSLSEWNQVIAEPVLL